MNSAPSSEFNGPAVRKKAITLSLSVVLTFLAGAVAMVKIHEGFGWITFGAVAICLVLLSRLTCPRCGKPIYGNEVRLFGVTWYYSGSFSPLPPNRCWKCDLSFREDSSRASSH